MVGKGNGKGKIEVCGGFIRQGFSDIIIIIYCKCIYYYIGKVGSISDRS